MLLSKFPGKIRDKWVRAVMDVRTKEHKSVPLLQTQSLIRRKKEIYRQQIHCVLHATKTILWIHARFSWKRLWRKEPNSWPTKGYAMAAINLWPVTTMPKPASRDCFAESAKSTIQQECMVMSRKLLKNKGKRDTEVISVCVVPVWVGHRNSRRMVKTYAMLDNCS